MTSCARNIIFNSKNNVVYCTAHSDSKIFKIYFEDPWPAPLIFYGALPILCCDLLISQGDSTDALIESTATQLLNTGSHVTTEQLLDKIEAISAEDVSNVVKKVWAKEPVLVSIGNGENMPGISEIL